MSEADALKTITLNGAKQLGLEKRLGSIEVGKDADMAIFNGHPLNSYASVDMTLVEGEVYFQRGGRLKIPAAASGPHNADQAPKSLPRSANGNYVISNLTVH